MADDLDLATLANQLPDEEASWLRQNELVSALRQAALTTVLLAAACTSSHHAAPHSQPRVAGLLGVQVCDPGHCPDDQIGDGPIPPDEPYRYVQPPSGVHRGLAPHVVRETVRLRNSGSLPATFLNSAEIGPQVAVFFAAGALRGTPGASVSVSATPIAPGGPAPADGRIVGNEYSLAATAVGPLTFVAGAMSVQLRVPHPVASARYLIELRKGESWVDLPTAVPGNDIVLARPPLIGTVAVVQTR